MHIRVQICLLRKVGWKAAHLFSAVSAYNTLLLECLQTVELKDVTSSWITVLQPVFFCLLVFKQCFYVSWNWESVSCVNGNLRLWLFDSVEMQCMSIQTKVHYGSKCQRFQHSPAKKKKKSLTTFIFLQRLMKTGKDLMKMLPMSPSLQSATLRLKWLKGHGPFMSFLIRGGLSGFSVMSQSPGRLLITSSEQQVGTALFKVWKKTTFNTAVPLHTSDMKKPRELALGL